MATHPITSDARWPGTVAMAGGAEWPFDPTVDPLLFQTRIEKGVPNGYAGLGPDGLVPAGQLPESSIGVGPPGPPGPPGVGGGTLFRKGLPALSLASVASPAFTVASFPGMTTATLLGGNIVDYRGKPGPTNPATGTAAAFGFYFSTDHDAGAGGIFLAVAQAPAGPWTAYNSGNSIWTDAASSGTETPCVVYHAPTQQWLMYYQTASGAGLAAQVTRMAVSANGATAWGAHGIVLDTPAASVNWPGAGHTGYFWATQFSESYAVGVSLMSSGNYSTLCLWRSRDLVRWVADPRPLVLNMVDAGGDPTRKVTFMKYFTLGGVPWALCAITTVGSGPGAVLTKTNYGAIGRVTSDLRKFVGPPVPVLLPDDSWENWTMALDDIVVIDEQPYISYSTATACGVAALTIV